MVRHSFLLEDIVCSLGSEYLLISICNSSGTGGVVSLSVALNALHAFVIRVWVTTKVAIGRIYFSDLNERCITTI